MRIPILPGDSFVDPMTSLESRVTSFQLARNDGDDGVDDVTVMPCNGGFENFLDCKKLAEEENTVEALQMLYDVITGRFERLVSFFLINRN